MTTSLQATPTATFSAVVSHSPPHLEYGGGTSGGASIDSISVGVGVTGALLIFITVPLIIITVLVCLRKRKNKLNTTDNVAYSSSSSVLQTNMAEIHTSLDYSYPQMSSSMDPLYVTPNEVCNDHNSSSEVTDNHIPMSANPAYHKGGKDVPTSTTSIPTSANLAYLEDGPVYEDADIPTSTNQSYLEEDLYQADSASDTIYMHYHSATDLS